MAPASLRGKPEALGGPALHPSPTPRIPYPLLLQAYSALSLLEQRLPPTRHDSLLLFRLFSNVTFSMSPFMPPHLFLFYLKFLFTSKWHI